MRLFSCYAGSIFLFLSLVIPVSCAQISGSGPVLSFKQSGGYAGIMKEWHIYANGRIVDAGGNNSRVAAAEVAQLHQDIQHSGFFDFAPSYIPKNACCDRFSYVITVYDGDRSHSVATLDQADGAPAELAAVLTDIRNLLAAAQK